MTSFIICKLDIDGLASLYSLSNVYLMPSYYDYIISFFITEPYMRDIIYELYRAIAILTYLLFFRYFVLFDVYFRKIYRYNIYILKDYHLIK
jgi:hypothetical protein